LAPVLGAHSAPLPLGDMPREMTIHTYTLGIYLLTYIRQICTCIIEGLTIMVMQNISIFGIGNAKYFCFWHWECKFFLFFALGGQILLIFFVSVSVFK
jgi:hypothetical protein